MKLKSLQLLRAVAASLVVYAHSIDLQMQFSVSRQQSFFHLQNFGAIGVDLFFVISGFIITLVSNEYLGGEAGKLFLIKRFLRINPLYYLASLLFLAGSLIASALYHSPALSSTSRWDRLLQTIAIFPLHHLPNKLTPLLIVGWTLAFEWLFYLLFFLLILFKSRHKPLLLIVMVSLLVACGRIGHFQNNQLVFITNPILLEFLLGVIICRLYTGVKAVSAIWPIVFLLAGVGWYSYEIVHGFGAISEMSTIQDGSLSMQRFLLWGIPSGLLVAGCVLLEKKAVFIWLWNNKWIQLAGDASYSIYLVHLIVFNLLMLVFKKTGFYALPDLSVFVQLALALAAGIVFYLYAERPLLKQTRKNVKKV